MYQHSNKLTEHANRLGCSDEIAELTQFRAIKFLQEKEGYLPCFGWLSALNPSISSNPHKKEQCVVKDCSWWSECNSARLGSSGSARDRVLSITLRDFILEKAYRVGCYNHIYSLSDREAIRTIQRFEGNTPCFADQKPLIPIHDRPTYCAISNCFWLSACDKYRNVEVLHLEMALPADKPPVIQQLKTWIREANAVKEAILVDNAVGLKIQSFNNLPSATRKMLLASPKTIIGESVSENISLKPYIVSQYDGGGWASNKPHIIQNFDVLFTADIEKLKRWLNDTQHFINSGVLAYYPLLETVPVERIMGVGNDTPSINNLRYPRQEQLETFHAPHLGIPDGDIMLTDPNFAPILNIDLPVLENIDYDTLFKLMEDYPNELCTFQDFLQSKVEEMRVAAVGSTDFGRACRNIEREIRDQLRKVDSDYKKARLASAFSLTGCAVAAWTLALFCIIQGTDNLLAVLGPSGITYTASSAYSDYLIKRLGLRENPVHFLWMLGKTKRKT